MSIKEKYQNFKDEHDLDDETIATVVCCGLIGVGCVLATYQVGKIVGVIRGVTSMSDELDKALVRDPEVYGKVIQLLVEYNNSQA